jgi:ABC-type bacteriocin/lantibiotic exporter with double-glycine peptidase domain
VSLASWLRFARLYRGSRGTLVLSGLMSIAQAVLLAPTALLVAHAFDDLVPKKDIGGLFLVTAAILATYLASAGLALLTRYLVIKTTKQAITELRARLIDRVYSLPRAYFDRKSRGRLHSIVVQDSERLDAMGGMLVGVLLPAGTVAIGLCVILAVLNPLMFGVLVTVVPVIMLLGRWLGRRVRQRMRRFQAAFDVFSTQTQLALRALTLTKVQGAEREEAAKRRSEHVVLAEAGRQVAWYQGAYYIVQNAVAASSGLLVLALGGRAVALHHMSLGDLLAFYAILALLLKQVTLAISVLPFVHAGYESLPRIEEILEADEQEPYSGTRRLDFEGGFEFEDVSFSYDGEPVLRSLSLTIEPGEHLAIFGPNGAGKSTLLNLLLGLYRPQGGRLLADGVPYDTVDIPALRRSIGVVLQDAFIFPGTIAENIAFGHSDATDEEIRWAARWATADDFVKRLPGGYETETGDEGQLLSGGQRQRIAIARALVARPAVLVLDEPTTHLDDTSIRTLLANLCDFPGAPTVILISHDPEIADHVDAIHHLRDGQIVRTDRLDTAMLVGGPLRAQPSP